MLMVDESNLIQRLVQPCAYRFSLGFSCYWLQLIVYISKNLKLCFDIKVMFPSVS